MSRPKGYKVSGKTRAAISAARAGRKWDSEIKDKIGSAVRKGTSNKVPFNTRIDPDIAAAFRKKAADRNLPLAIATEKAFEQF